TAVFPIWLKTGYRYIYIQCKMSNASNPHMNYSYMTFQRRKNGKVNFLRGWKNYVNGFGNPNGEYWVGLENVYLLTRQNKRALTHGYSTIRPTLRIDMKDWDGVRAYAVYKRFTISSDKYNYQVSDIGKRTGTVVKQAVSDPFFREEFTSFDHIREGLIFYSHCPQPTNGGWWFSFCSHSNLNGRYPGPLEKMSVHNIYWRSWSYINKNNSALRY
uniref:Fibrinogen C-terminal domain-containing protein n=1 Tax=Ciona savignyi TaxID=51511 RepID=H2Z1S1_CIOSA